jgi:hypothetical protein
MLANPGQAVNSCLQGSGATPRHGWKRQDGQVDAVLSFAGSYPVEAENRRGAELEFGAPFRFGLRIAAFLGLQSGSGPGIMRAV